MEVSAIIMGQRVRAARQAKKMKTEELAEKVNIAVESIGHIECGARKPAAAPLYRCDKCGWEPEDPKNPPRFCPECGDRFDEDDAK